MTEARERWKQIHDEMAAATRRPGRLFWDACKRIAELEAENESRDVAFQQSEQELGKAAERVFALETERDDWRGAAERWEARAKELEAERDALPDFAERARKAEWFIEKEGYRRCDNPACNCDSWHARDGWYARFQEIKEVLDPGNGETLLDCAKRVVAERDSLSAWSCDGCGARFDPGVTRPEMLDGVTKCSKCVEVEVLSGRIAELDTECEAWIRRVDERGREALLEAAERFESCSVVFRGIGAELRSMAEEPAIQSDAKPPKKPYPMDDRDAMNTQEQPK